MSERTKKDAEAYRLLQAQELLTRFFEANGRAAETTEELEAWISKQSFPKPVVPRPELLRLQGDPKNS